MSVFLVFASFLATLSPSPSALKAVLGDSTWDLGTAGEYTYDSNKIEFSGGVAQLKGASTPGTDWIATDGGGNNWGFRRQVTFNNLTSYLGTASENLINFPVLIKLTAASIDYSKTQDLGQDLRFTDSDSATALKYEIEKWDETGISYVWVKVPQININSNTDYIYMYYGNSSATDGQDAANVWDSNFKGVWHLNETSGTTSADSTSNSNIGTKLSATEPNPTTLSQIAGAQSFDGNNDYIRVGTSSTLNPSVAMTVDAWIYISSNTNYGAILARWGAGGNSYFIGTNPNTSQVAIYFSGALVYTTPSLPLNQWVNLSITHNGSTVSAYQNGVYLGGGSSGSITASNQYTSIGYDYNRTNYPFSSRIDEVRVSNSSRSSAWIAASYKSESDDNYRNYGSETTLFPTDNPTLVPNTGQGYSTVSAFTQTLGAGSSGNIKYQVSPDDGVTWYWYTAGAWTATVAGYTESNTATDVNTYFADSSFNSIGSNPKTLKWRAYFNSDGSQQPKLDNLVVTYIWDTADPDNPAAIATAKSQAAGGADITTNTWYNYPAPYFTWTEPNDNANPGETISGIAGYYVYFGTTATADPHVSGVYQTGLTYTASSLASGSTYYLRIETQDNAGNIHDIAAEDPSLFIYKYDSTAPTSPTYVSVSPSGYTRTNSFTFSWPVAGENAAQDTGGSGLTGYQYKINTGAWSDTFNDGSVALSDIASTGVNIFYLRAVDTAGNYDLTPVQTNFYFNASAPTAPQNLTVTPTTNSLNSFAFSWTIPLTYSGSIDGYYYSINALPTLANTSYTTAVSLAADAYATQQGTNTFYIVAKDESDNYDFASCSSISGNPAVDSCAKVEFTADTAAPGRPTAVQIFDISNRDTQEYAITLKWTAPTSLGAGFSGYEIYRSTNGSSFASIGTTTGTTYANTDLSSRIYYYYIRSKDNANQYSAASETVSITPTGKWTTPPNLVGQPKITVGSFTATITWQTDREGSSFIEYGTSPDKIGTANGGETKGQLDDVMDHSVGLKGLHADTTYYYQAVWVDVDGNQGTSGTLTFTTKTAPKVSEVDSSSNITLNSILVNWSTTVTANCSINYGETTAYGGILREDSGSFASAHSINIQALDHSTTYHFQINCYDTDNNLFSSDDYKEATLTMPQISEFRFETVADAPTTTLKFTWKTNVPTTSIASYSPSGGQAQTQSKADYETDHDLTASDLSDKTIYSLQAKGVDQHGNTAQSETATFTTPDDTRPPKISELTVEVKSSGFGTAQKSQVVVGWQTDEPGTSQVEYAQGISGQEYNFKTKEDGNLAISHVVIIPDLDPSKIYHLRAVSRDKANNLGSSEDTTVITGKEQKGILDIIINSLSASLGWLFKIFQR